MDRVVRNHINIFVFIFCFCAMNYAQSIEINDFIEVTHKRNGTPYTDEDVLESIVIKKDGKFYKRKNIHLLSPIDFGAKGDGISDDSQAFISILKYFSQNGLSIVNLSGDYVFNLNAKTINIPKRLALKFNGVILKNGTLDGDNTSILAEPVKIFDNVDLVGHFVDNGNNFVEWFGTFPNEINSVDLKYSMEKLNKVFFEIKLNSGIYYTKIGNIPLKGLRGVGQDRTFVELVTANTGEHLFHIGEIGGVVAQRTYDSNVLESLSLVLTPKKRVNSTALLVIGASHKAVVRDVKFIMNSPDSSINSDEELYRMVSDESLMEKANVGIVFDGCSELINIDNIFTLSDIGIKFNKNADFVNINNYTSWNGKYGLATVYFKDTTSSNILFGGNQSWSQGLFGVYATNETGYNSFVNVKFENLRIEQLNDNIKSNGKAIATSFRFGNYTHIPNLIFDNIMLGGTGNGFRFGKVKDGKITIRNTQVFYDKTVPRDYAFSIEFSPDAEMNVEFFSTQLPQDLPMKIKGAKIVSEEKGTKNYWGTAKIERY
ncbi:hypothetical protein [Riemerella anatipestifer]|uniref:hypothetical protein n=1 Tax=Riemerella anatipestifer TaxID=34085 RepID=UPI001C86C639|nr:hypothetical protein [Riemerella anatipestifer]